MRTTTQSFQIIEQGDGREAMLRHIEACGRVAYKSEDRITDDSAEAFVQRLIKNGHGSPLEHGTVYAKTPKDVAILWQGMPHTRVTMSGEYGYVTTNYRMAINAAAPIGRFFRPRVDGLHQRRVTVKIITNRAVANEFVRHRVFSFTQESTRYVDYGKRGVEFILPTYADDDGRMWHWQSAMETAEDEYNRLLAMGCSPQEARGVLPLDTKTEMVMTGFTDEWDGFFKLRCAKAAHPQARGIANQIREEFLNREYITQ